MKLQLYREALLKPLQMVIGVVERKQTMPVLSNVLLSVKDDKLSITGTDLEVELIGHSPITEMVATPSQLTLPGRKLMDICRALPDNAAIELYYNKDKVTLKSGRSRFTLASLPADDFPSAELKPGQVNFLISQHQLKMLLHRTYFAMAQQDVRYYLNGLLLELKPNQLRAVATDGHRLATNALEIKIDIDHRMQIIVPRKGILELLRLLDDSENLLQVTVGSHYIKITSDTLIFTSKLVEGRFPDYEQAIPKSSAQAVAVDGELLRRALSRSAIMCGDKIKGVRIELRQNLLRILSQNPDHEAAEEELVIDYSGQDLDVGFNVNYILDILSTIETDPVTLHFIDANGSLLVEEMHQQWQSTFVVMPMRL